MERIHIFVPVYFREETVRRCVDRLLETCPSDGYDVRLILVDNKSNDSLRDYLREIPKRVPWVNAILLDGNHGKGPAINDASKEFGGFDWFVSCDSDIFHLHTGWPGIMAECFKQIPRAGMVSTDYLAVNNPMPRQPNVLGVIAAGKEWKFNWGGPVAGGCFITSAEVWNQLHYRCRGVYGGVDGMFRQRVADQLSMKCGYLEGLTVEHVDDRETYKEYNDWKLSVQDKIRVLSPMANPVDLGNKKGFWDE